jgi:starch synthase
MLVSEIWGDNRMNILLVATEAGPYAKTGGLADVVHGFAKELLNAGCDVRIVIPSYYGRLAGNHVEEIVPRLNVSLGLYSRDAGILKQTGASDEPCIYLIHQDFYFGRSNIYGYLDDYERFTFFARASLEMLSTHEFGTTEKNWFPQIIQGYDWTTGFIPMWLPEFTERDNRFAQTRFMLSIFNLGTQGVFAGRALRVSQMESKGLYKELGETAERVSFLGRGVLFADRVVTVNPKYTPEENPLPETVQNLRSLFEKRLAQGDLVGIKNAIDYSKYDPTKDPNIRQPFAEYSVRERVRNKSALQQELGLDQDERAPLLGMVTRLITAKGWELIDGLQNYLASEDDVQFVALVEPTDPNYARIVRSLGNNNRIRVIFGFDDALARRIYAGCDIFLIPSKEEPCGIQQLIAMHYGAIPVVHDTGALRVSVAQFQPGTNIDSLSRTDQGIGFKFADFTSSAFEAAIRAAVVQFRENQSSWSMLQRVNMGQNFSWFNVVNKYLDEYRHILSKDRSIIHTGTPITQPDRNQQLLQAILEIDSLPGLARRDSSELLKQAARLVREVVQGDAVYVWVSEQVESIASGTPEAGGMKLISESLHHREARTPPDQQAVADLLNEGTSGVWGHVAEVNMSGMCRPILGLSSSGIAQRQQWIAGRSVLISAHSRIIGRIDVLFSEEPFDDDWLGYALITLANSFGFRLETIRLSQRADQSLETSLQLLQARSFIQATQEVLNQAKKVSNAKNAWLYLCQGNDFELIDDGNSYLEVDDLAHTVIRLRDTVYRPDWQLELKRADKQNRSLRSLMMVPLINPNNNRAIGVLAVAKAEPAAFSHDEETILKKRIAPQAAIVLEVAKLEEQSDRSRVTQLEKLAASLVAEGDLLRLLEAVVTTTAEVLHAKAASLYLVDDRKKLVIRAASGYHKSLLGKAEYDIGEGVTGWIAKQEKTFRADTLEELHRIPAWKGKHRELQDYWEPNVFLGIPLRVTINRETGEQKVIGVLKLEDRDFPNEGQAVFTEEDERLGEMMANVIATVVYNTQVSDAQLQKLSNNLSELSAALAGGQEMRILVDQVVRTMAGVLRAKASSLYLIDEATGLLVIQAATGYQEGLVKRTATYKVGEGVTGWIAEQGELFRANDLDELHKHPAWKGKQNPGQGGQEPASFLGVPLKVKERFTGNDKVIGVLKIEDLQPDSDHPDAFFNNQDVLLVEMMANVIATVIYNNRQGYERIGAVLGEMGTLSAPVNAVPLLLRQFATSDDEGIIDQLATVIASELDSDPSMTEPEIMELFNVHAQPMLYDRISKRTGNETVRWNFSLFHSILTAERPFASWEEVASEAVPWIQLKNGANDSKLFAEAAQQLTIRLANSIQVEADSKEPYTDFSTAWFAVVLNTQRVFGEQIEKIPLLFQRQGDLDETNFGRMRELAENNPEQKYSVVILVTWNSDLSQEQIAQMREYMSLHAIDIVVLNITTLQRILSSASPVDAFHGQVMRQVTRITPFVIVGPVPDAMFFGRSLEMNDIVNHLKAGRSCAVLAGRRFGKTSILMRLHRVHLPKMEYRSVFFDCSVLKNNETLDTLRAQQVHYWHKQQFDSPPTFGELLDGSSADRPLVFLLDEADQLVYLDKLDHWSLFADLRARANSRSVQFVLSGDRYLRDEMENDKSPLFNLFNPVTLGSLRPEEVEELVTQPMKQLEIELKPVKAIVNSIFEFTSGHPNIVQRICNRLISSLRENRRWTLTLDDVENVTQDIEFGRDDFLSTYLQQATVLEHLCALLMASDTNLSTLKDIHQAIHERGIPASLNEINDALERLVNLRNILTRTRDGYKFRVQAFPLVVSRLSRIDDLILLRCEFYKGQGDTDFEGAPQEIKPSKLW